MRKIIAINNIPGIFDASIMKEEGKRLKRVEEKIRRIKLQEGQ